MNSRRIDLTEWALAALLSVMMIALLVVRAMHAGALWRDEAGMVQLALMPLGELFKNFQHQTLPPLFPLGLRVYLQVFGTSDAALQGSRILGGIALIAAAGLGSRVLGAQPPLLLLALFGLNPVFLYWGLYSLPATTIATVVLLAAGVIVRPSRKRIIGLGAAAIISVHLIINSLLMILIIMGSAIVACVLRRSYRLACIFASVLVLSAASTLIYLPAYAKAADWRIVLQHEISIADLWPQIQIALGSPKLIMTVIWCLTFAAAVAAATWRLYLDRRRPNLERSALAVFSILVSLLTPTVYCISFLAAKMEGYDARHFLPMLAIIAANFDVVVFDLTDFLWIRAGRALLALIILVVVPFVSWGGLTLRQTNIDLIAHRLEREAGANDLIIVNPWAIGLSFNWYYHGKTPWRTVPNISDHRIHRFDLLKEKMMMAYPLEDLERESAATLDSGHRVWIVGVLSRRHPNDLLFPLAAPDPEVGWYHMYYRKAWSRQLREFLMRHTSKAEQVIKSGPGVNALENETLSVLEGKRE